MPETIRSLTTDEAAALELPEDRVRAFSEAWHEHAEPEGVTTINSIAATRLEAADVRDVLAELEAWRALAHSRLTIMESLAGQVTDLLHAVKPIVGPWLVGHDIPDSAVDKLADAVLAVADPAPQGDPITAETD